MKKVLFLVAVTVTLGFSAFGQINMDNSGKVGIGGIPTVNRLTVWDRDSSAIYFGISNLTTNPIRWSMTSRQGGANVFRFRDHLNGAKILDLARSGSYLYTRLTINNDLYATNLYATTSLNAPTLNVTNLTATNITATNNITSGNTITAPNMNATTSLSTPSLNTNDLSASNRVKVNSYGIINRYWANSSNFDFNTNRSNTIPDYWGFLFENTYNYSSGFYCDFDFSAIWSRGTFNRLLSIIDIRGRVERAYINLGGLYVQSDKNRKENIEPIKSALEKIKNLNGVTYDFIKSEEERKTNDSIINGLIPYAGKIEDFRRNIENKDCGFIAQELETVIPEVVETSEDGSKFVNYDGVIPFLAEAIKEQQAIIESLQIQIQELKGGTRGSTLNDPKVSEAQKNILYQNIPNPFSQSTVIEYAIAGNAKNAMICIYNMNGNQLKCNPINPAGHGSIVINGSELSAGMYLYSLIVDGQLVDTKRMVLTN